MAAGALTSADTPASDPPPSDAVPCTAWLSSTAQTGGSLTAIRERAGISDRVTADPESRLAGFVVDGESRWRMSEST